MGKLQHPVLKADSMRMWSVEDSMELYNVRNWGNPYYNPYGGGWNNWRNWRNW